MKKLQNFFAVIILFLSLFITLTIIYRNGYFNDYLTVIENFFNNAQAVAYSYSGNYEILSGSGSLIEDSEVNSLGNSEIDGSDYTFDTLFYPYYGMLSSSEKEVYAQVYANAIAYEDSFVPISQVSVSDVVEIMEAVYSDHPELYYLSTKYGYLYTSKENCVQITLEYNELINDISSSTSSFENAANNIIASAKELSSDYEKEKYVHDAIARLCTYDENSSLSQSAYSALVNGNSVCAGYSRAFQYIMTSLGIPTYFVAGTATGNHAWNMVKLDDGYYNVDLTWDDQDSGVIYNYFNLTDAEFSSTHTRTNFSVNLPSCDSSDYCGLESTSDIAEKNGVPDNSISVKTDEPSTQSEIPAENSDGKDGQFEKTQDNDLPESDTPDSKIPDKNAPDFSSRDFNSPNAATPDPGVPNAVTPGKNNQNFTP